MECCRDRYLLKPLLKSENSNHDISLDGDLVDGTRVSRKKGRNMGLFLRRIWLLQWKNLLFRRRHYLVTISEILLPTLFAVLMAYMRTETTGFTSSYDNITTYKEISEGELKELLVYDIKAKCRKCLIAFSPMNDLTQQIIDHTRGTLESAILQVTGPKPDFSIDWRMFKTEEEIIAYSAQLQLNNTGHETLRAAIVFKGGFGQKKSNQISYKIRIVDDEDIFRTNTLFPSIQLPGPDSESIFRYSGSGFSGFQILLDKAIVNVLTGKNITHTISQQAFPYPPYEHSIDFKNFYFILMPQFLVLGFVFIVPSIIRTIVSEKETGIKELMKLMGLPTWMHWLGYMLNSLLVLTISITLVVVLFFMVFNSKSGAVLVHGDPTLWWFVLFLYAISSTTFCFFISSLFQRPTLAICFGIMLWLVSYYAVATPLESNYQTLGLGEKLFVALLPNMALHWAVKVLCAFETRAIGGRWSNIFESISSVDSMCLGVIILMFVINSIMYILLTLYVESVIPSEFGLRKPWYFIFKPSWLFKGRSSTRPSTAYSSTQENSQGFEKDPHNVQTKIEIFKLRKVFGKNKVAVDDINLKIFEGQITALLGHNGAGKTTTISMLTGLFSPSSGSALVNGYDIITEMDKVRNNLGLCPQHNMLFDRLTVGEHLRFFGMLKGMTSAESIKDMKEILHKLQLTEKMDALALTLSGGQKRKLSLGIALVGNAQVVFLDEPTSGMDPENRRAIWDLLLEMRGKRTIILTTHFMEEADVLGERIAIMADGKVQCCGSPLFLKNYYGAGYTLKLTGSLNQELILQNVQKFINKAYLKDTNSPSQNEMGITLPLENNPTGKFPAMFADLTKNKRNFGIQTIGLGLTTMDEVFVKVEELSHPQQVGHDYEMDLVKRNEKNNDLNSRQRSTLINDRLRGLRLISMQFNGLLWKRMLYTYRKRRLVLSQMVIPLLLLICAIHISNKTFEGSDPPQELVFKLSDYRNPVTLYSTLDETLGNIYEKLIGSTSKVERIVGNLTRSLADIGEKDLAAYRERYIIASEINQTNFKTMFSTIPLHSAPISINLATNTLLRNLSPENDFKIVTSNHPLRSALEILIEAAKPNPIFATTIPILFAVFLPIGLALIAASFIVFPVEERLCKAKQLQIMTNVSPLIYWISSFIWDFCIMFVVICLMVLCFPIFQNYEAFTSYNGAGVVFLILIVYGYSSISFSYLFSTFVQTVAGGFAFVTIIHIVTGMIFCLVVFSLEVGGLLHAADYIRDVGRFFPTFGAAISIMRFTEIATTNSRCNILSESAKKIVCDVNVIVDAELRSCCDNCAQFGVCFEPKPYITWNLKKNKMFQETILPGIGQELLIMIGMAFLYQFLLLLIEYRVFDKIIRLLFKSNFNLFNQDVQDEDVQGETERVANLIKSGRASEDSIVVDSLCRNYGSFAAVSNITFGVAHGECFGLLGVNGAGKTTCFRMLTGDEIPSNGNSFCENFSLVSHQKEFLSILGYCPQFDALIGVLTGREMLELFAKLRGIPSEFVAKEAAKWLNKMGLSDSGDIQCQKYSGGMKRRLSTAIALVGDSPIILLDEPTSGVDPVARRQFWNVISSVKENGQAVILTSHSMEECEALCSRLAIMVNGQIQCFGGVQHLKSKFAQGFSLSIKLKAVVPPDSEELLALKNEIQTNFDPCMLKDYHQNVLHYQLSNTSMPWDELFKRMEDLKEGWENIIEEYSVNETTLEEVFLSFARKQYPERTANISFLKKFLTCQYF